MVIGLAEYFKRSPSKTKNILLVDDEDDLGWILKKVIRDAGHKLVFASTFKAGLEKFKKSRNLDIAIIDLRLVDKSGLDFVKKSRQINDKVKFVMISAFGTQDVKDKARELGVRYFLDKPLKAEKLLDLINKDCA